MAADVVAALLTFLLLRADFFLARFDLCTTLRIAHARGRCAFLARGGLLRISSGLRSVPNFAVLGVFAAAVTAAAFVLVARAAHGFFLQPAQFFERCELFTMKDHVAPFGAVAQPHLDAVAQMQNLDDLAFAHGRADHAFDLRQHAAGLHVLLEFIDQAAAQAAAHAGDVVRVEAEVLFLGVLDRDWAEFGEEARTAAFFDAAGAEATEQLRDLARADLSKLEPGAVQVAHAFAQGAYFDALFLVAGVQEGERLPVE